MAPTGKKGVPRGDSGVAIGEEVKDGDGEQVRTAGVRVSGRARKAMGPRQKRANQRQESSTRRGAEAEDGEEIFRHDVDDAHGSDGPVKSNHAGGDGYALAEAG